MTSAWALAILLSYLSGSIPFGHLMGLAKGVDLRKHGSGNIGATNCGRVLGRKYGILCFVLDLLKGFVPVFAAGCRFGLIGGEGPIGRGTEWSWLMTAAAAVVGHVFPIWLGFKGGKGVATGLGVILGVWPHLTLPALAAIGTWLIVAGLSLYVGLSSVVAAVALPAYVAGIAVLRHEPIDTVMPYLVVTVAMAGLIVLRHRGNLIRTWKGTENRLGHRKVGGGIVLSEKESMPPLRPAP